MTTPQQTTPFPLRMPAELRERLEARAKKNRRSANAEIVAMVSAALDTDAALASIPTDDLLAVVLKRLGASVHIVIPEGNAKDAGISPGRKK